MKLLLIYQLCMNMDEIIVPGDRRYYEPVACSNKGCKWNGLYGIFINEHRKECDFEKVHCKFCNVLCERQRLNKHHNLNPTKETMMEGCSKAKIHCPFCRGRYERQNMKVHMNVNPAWDDREKGCDRTPLKCKFCKKTFERQQLEVHLNLNSTNESQLQGCDYVQISCNFCKELFERKQLRLHLNLCPTKDNWKQGCEKAIVHCPFCKSKIARHQLSEHLNMNPLPQNWLEGCDTAEVKCIYCREEFKRWQLKVKAKKMDVQLDDTHCGAVLATSFNAREKWYEIGLELKVDAKILDGFKAKHKGSADACFYETIKVWLASKEQKSWKTLVKALSSGKVGLLQEAKEVERSKYTFAVHSLLAGNWGLRQCHIICIL